MSFPIDRLVFVAMNRPDGSCSLVTDCEGRIRTFHRYAIDRRLGVSLEAHSEEEIDRIIGRPFAVPCRLANQWAMGAGIGPLRFADPVGDA